MFDRTPSAVDVTIGGETRIYEAFVTTAPFCFGWARPKRSPMTALFLASDGSSYITGTDIVVDGGWFSSAAYLGNERSNNMLQMLLKTKEQPG